MIRNIFIFFEPIWKEFYVIFSYGISFSSKKYLKKTGDVQPFHLRENECKTKISIELDIVKIKKQPIKELIRNWIFLKRTIAKAPFLCLDGILLFGNLVIIQMDTWKKILLMYISLSLFFGIYVYNRYDFQNLKLILLNGRKIVKITQFLFELMSTGCKNTSYFSKNCCNICFFFNKIETDVTIWNILRCFGPTYTFYVIVSSKIFLKFELTQFLAISICVKMKVKVENILSHIALSLR